MHLRERILSTASRQFYERGMRAVGADLVVLEAAVAKTSLYRYFPTKDDLIVAFLEREDLDFRALWDSVAATRADDPAAELAAHMQWIAEPLERANYCGCAQINVAAEFAETALLGPEEAAGELLAALKAMPAGARNAG